MLTNEQITKVKELVAKMEDTHMYAYDRMMGNPTYENKENFKAARREFFSYYNSLTDDERLEVRALHYRDKKSVEFVITQELFSQIFN